MFRVTVPILGPLGVDLTFKVDAFTLTLSPMLNLPVVGVDDTGDGVGITLVVPDFTIYEFTESPCAEYPERPVS